MKASDSAGDPAKAQPLWLARLAHDLRDPITPLRFAVQQLRAGQVSAGDQDTLFQLMDRQIDSVLSMADDVADLVRIDRGDFRLHLGPAGLSDIVSAAVRALGRSAAPASATVNVRVESCELLVVLADDARLSQLLVHLLRTIGAGGYEDSRAEIQCDADEHVVQLIFRNLDRPIAHSARLEYLMTGQLPTDARGLTMANLISREVLVKHAARLYSQSTGDTAFSALVLELPRAQLPEFVAFEP